MTRSKLLLAWGALLLGLSACDKTTSTDSDSGTSSLTVTVSPSEITAGGTSASVSIQATGAGKITSLKAEVLTSAGVDASTSFSTDFSKMPKSTDSSFSTNAWTVSAKSGALAGPYKVRVTLTDKSGNTVKEYPFSVRSGSTTDPDPLDPLWPKIDLGAQGATPPSALDVDGLEAFSSGAKTPSEIASIDLLLYNESTGGLRFVSPEYASNKSFSLVDGWGQTNATYFYDNGTTPVTSLEQTQSILSEMETEQYINVIVGHYYIVEHSGGVTSVIKVESITGSGNSSVVKVSIVFSDDTFAG